MKRIVLFISLFTLSVLSYSQEPLSITEVIQVEGVSKDNLYDRAKLWFAENFRDANSVLQVDDKQGGQLVGKAVMIYKPSMIAASDMFKGKIWYNVKITVREGRYKYEIGSFTHEADGGKFKTIHLGLITTSEDCPDNIKGQPKFTMNKYWRDVKVKSISLGSSLASSIKETMSKSITSQDDDW